MMLADKFAGKAPPDVGGPTAGNRLEYQQNWALCKILSIHELQNDYFVVFDYHNDVVIFDSEEKPLKIALYQVKTKNSAHWTTAELIRDKKGNEKTSMLAQMYYSHKPFEDYCENLCFITNQGWSCKVGNDSKNKIHKSVTFDELCNDVKHKVHLAVQGNDADHCDVKGLSRIKLEVTSLALGDHVAHTKGRLSDFFDSNYGAPAIRIGPVYQALMGEIRLKNNNEKRYSKWSDLKRYKGLGKKAFATMIQQVLASNDQEPPWSATQVLLRGEGYSISELRQLKPYMIDVYVKKIANKANSLDEFFRTIKSEISNYESTNPHVNLRDLEQYLLSHGSKNIRLSHLEISFIRAAIIHEYIS